ncbi:hypothetical protein bcere0028_17200 [Bacillus cereus AH1271]|nr:hypothetical protein bcere0028_17200 [Bacillus cereus AH1271]
MVLFIEKVTTLFFIRGGINMDINNLIIENMDNPHELERMYRKDPKAFKKSFS